MLSSDANWSPATAPIRLDGDQWVMVEIEVNGDQDIVHRVGGKEVLRYREAQLDPGDASAKKLLAAGQPKLLTGGTISLQSESHPVEFRRVDILVR